MVENCPALVFPVFDISPFIILNTGPVAMITGRKNIALARERPLNF